MASNASPVGPALFHEAEDYASACGRGMNRRLTSPVDIDPNLAQFKGFQKCSHVHPRKTP